MAYAEEYVSLQAAIVRERQLKRWTVDKKEALIRRDASLLRALGRSRNRARSSLTFTWNDLLKRNSSRQR
jgi:hypothetical protein